MKSVWNYATVLCCIVAVAGCMTAADHSRSLASEADREMTVGTVQREIRVGMTGGEVAEALGSPNIVTKNAEGNETWIYDKIASEASYSRDSGGTGASVGAAGAPGATLLLGLISGNYSRDAGASSSTQKTLTVVIHFDADGFVNSFSYHTSKF